MTDESLYRRFCAEVQANLHVVRPLGFFRLPVNLQKLNFSLAPTRQVFTMNPASPDFANRSATSPALFNRCVVDWFGEWSPRALFQVAYEFTKTLDLGDRCGEKERQKDGHRWSRRDLI